MKKIAIKLVILCVFIYAIVWLLFILDGPLPTGNGLSKSDWLSFLSSAIGGGITLILGGVVYWQNKRLETYSKDANNISKKQYQLERNQNRPYFRMYKQSFVLAISKATYGFSQEYRDSINYDLNYKGSIPFDNQESNNCYPPAINLLFDIENTGSVNASEIKITRLRISDGITGNISGFSRNLDTSTIFDKKQRILVEIMQQIVLDNVDETNIDSCNKIAKHYSDSLNSILRLGHIELRLNYKDIFGEEYFQEYSIHYSYELNSETDYEYIFEMKNVEIEHHTDKSPYGPRS